MQDALERAVGEIAGHAVTVIAAGRTDAGVHAASQIVHSKRTRSVRITWVRGVNAHLPSAVAVLWAHAVPEDFHARFAATARHYTYLLLVRAERPALLAGLAGWYHRPLDVSAMDVAATQLLGTHDFSAFRAAECQAKTPVKTLARINVTQQGPFVRFEFSANAFLHHMVRNIVGERSSAWGGQGQCGWLAGVLAGRDRSRAAPTFAAEGLYLAGADYDARFGLPPTVRAVTLAGTLVPK